jgi:thymidylate synthase
MENYDNIYLEALNTVYNTGIKEKNNRTNSETIRKFGLEVILKDVNYIPLLNIRKMYPKSIAAELAWTLSGLKSTEWLNKHTSIWKHFETNGEVSTAYGYRWRYAFKRDQIVDLISLLKNDKSSRQAVVITWDPHTDGLLNQGKEKNVPCPYSFVVNVMNNKTNMLVSQRSADMILGLPYDIAMYSLLNQGLAKSIGTYPGDIKFTIADAHIYEQFYDIIPTLNKNNKEQKKNIRYCSPFIETIQENPDGYIHYINEITKKYNPVDNIRIMMPNI